MKKTVEKLKVYNLSGKFLEVQLRDKFYSEIKSEYDKKGFISKKIKTIRLILMNSAGRIYLQKRSKIKEENPGLYDKTVGGHVNYDDSDNMTVVRECAEELGFPATILPNKDFRRAIITTDLSIIGIFRKVDEILNFESIRVDTKGNEFLQPMITSVYVGYYDGAIRFVDGESSGIEVFSLDELGQEMKKNPGKFTEDIKFMFKNYKKYLKSIKLVKFK